MATALQTLRRLLRGLAAGVLRVAVLALGAVAAGVALLLGLALMLGLLLWSLLRGRGALPPNVFVRRGRSPRRTPTPDVVDVPVREIEPAAIASARSTAAATPAVPADVPADVPAEVTAEVTEQAIESRPTPP